LRETGEVVQNPVLLAPIEPSTIFAIGLNYREHAIEMDKPIPEYPVVTMKSPTALLDPGGEIVLPCFLPSDSVDYECELVIVIGKTCKNATKENALDHVLGYTAANDVSARDWRKIYSGGQWCKGKTFDTFCPLGPVVVTPDEIGDPDALQIRTELNGEEVQCSKRRFNVSLGFN
jgi:2-keto-4-pentenoate hydratase/2-oxohepta-3-ene-1,7-dioic acid hydratase in catechol pathway